VSEGTKNIRRLICDGNGVRLLNIHPRCAGLIRELQMYRYDPASNVAAVGEPKPLKLDDHHCDSLRYLCWHLRYD
jgi:phage terminase large subunit